MSECTVCEHAQLAEIDASLKNGVSVREIARRFSVPKSNVARHRQTCILRADLNHALQKRQAEQQDAALQSSSELARELAGLKTVISGYLDQALQAGKTLPLALVRELRATQELLVKTTLALETREASDDDLVPFLRRLEEAEAKLSELEGKRALAVMDT